MKKQVIVSGASGSLGSAVVNSFLEAGYSVSGLYHSKPAKISNENYEGYKVDLSDENQTNKSIQSILRDKKRIDVLVCTAGGFEMGNFEGTQASDLMKQYNLNFITAYNLVHVVYTKMKLQGSGHIFLIGSKQGSNAKLSTKTVAYGLSKSLLFHLSEILNKDSAGKIVVSVIVPSTIDTKANRGAMPDADFSSWPTPEEIADIIVFYSSPKASSIREPVIKVFKNS